jgi:hypothetical protein
MIRFARRLQPGEYQMTRDDPIMTMETGFNSADLSLSIRYFATRPADRAEWSFGVPAGLRPEVSWGPLCCRCHGILADHRRFFPPAFLNGAISGRGSIRRLREPVQVTILPSPLAPWFREWQWPALS